MKKEFLSQTCILDCTNITFDNFVWQLKSTFRQAVHNYHNANYNKWLKNQYTRLNERIESDMQYWVKIADKKYKSERGKQKFLEDKREEVIIQSMESCKRNQFDELTYFDFDVEPLENSIHGYCIITKESLENENSLKALYEHLINNKYFKRAKGWVFYNYKGFRPQIELIVDEDVQKEMEMDKKNLSDAINNFYANCKYCGD